MENEKKKEKSKNCLENKGIISNCLAYWKQKTEINKNKIIMKVLKEIRKWIDEGKKQELFEEWRKIKKCLECENCKTGKNKWKF